MDLVLWRHAEAAPGSPDEKRSLTEKGKRDAGKMALWLKRRLPPGDRVLASPAQRAQQTAQALTDDFETVAAIGTGASADTVIKIVRELSTATATLIVVGHQPTLGQVAGALLCDQAFDGNIKSGAIIWLRLTGASATELHRISPELLD